MKPEDETPKLALPPVIQARNWSRHHVFRETFLVEVTTPSDNESLRVFGDLLNALVNASCQHWPAHREGGVRPLLRAMHADLRYLLYLLDTLEVANPKTTEEHIVRHLHQELGAVAKRLARRLK
jgi:hypothetical protein